MRKFVSIFTVMLAATFSLTAIAQEYTKDCRKKAASTAKQMAKELKKAKWEYAGSIPLESAFEEYNLKTSDCGAYEAKNATVNNIKYIATGEKSCSKQIAGEIAAECYSEVMGKSMDEDGLNGDGGDRFENNKQATKYQGQLNGVVSRVITLTKKEANGLYTVRCFFLVDKAKKQKLITQMGKDYEKDNERADKIEDSINRTFKD